MSDVTAEPSTLEALAERHDLQRVGGRPRLGRYLAEIWQRRWFALTMARSMVRAKNSLDRLGPAWTFLKPLLEAAVYLAVFGGLVGAGRDIPNFPAYLVIGVFTFHYLSNSVRNAATSLTGNASLVRSLQFPRAVLPIVSVLQQLILLAPMTLIMLVVVAATGVLPTWSWLLVPVVFAVETFFNVGLGLVFARISSHSHDFTQLLPFVMRLWFYLSGIFWSVERVAGIPWLRFLFEVNPGFVYIQMNRDALLPEVPDSDFPAWPLGIGWAVLAIVVGVVFFWRAEDRYGRH